jgi:hypothetical protein
MPSFRSSVETISASARLAALVTRLIPASAST